MAITGIQGLMGSGKSYVAVNRLAPEFFRDSERPIYFSCHFQIDIDTYLCDLTSNVARREKMRARLHILEDEDREAFDAEGNSLGVHNMLREFWYFTLANAVVFLDELAEIYSANDHKKRPELLLVYVNQHRHFKDDLFFFFQVKEDVDVLIRRKMQYLMLLRNSLKENIADVFLFRGMHWPVQFFICKTFLARQIIEKNPDTLDLEKIPLQDYRVVWPRARGFRNYKSFSEPSKMSWKKAAGEDATSSDFQPSVWKRVQQSLSKSGLLLSYIAGGIVAAFLVGKALYSLATVDSADVKKVMGKEKRTEPLDKRRVPGVSLVGTGLVGSAAVATVLGESNISLAQTNFGGGQTASKAEGKEKSPERVLLASSVSVVTTKGEYGIGAKLGTGVIARVLFNGVEFEGGERVTFERVFFQGD